MHGDSHYHRIDKPLLDAQGRRLENFTRVETFGDNQANGTNDVNWLRVIGDPRSREVFAYQQQIVPRFPRRSQRRASATATVPTTDLQRDKSVALETAMPWG